MTTEAPMTNKAPVLLLSDKLLKEKIESQAGNFEPKNQYNLYLLNEENNNFVLYIFLEEPQKNEIQLENASIQDKIEKIISIPKNVTLQLFTEQLLNATDETKNILSKYTFHLEKGINLEELLEKYKLEPSGNIMQYNEEIPKIQQELDTPDFSSQEPQEQEQEQKQEPQEQYKTASNEKLTNYLINCINEIETDENKKQGYENEINDKFEVYTNSGANNCFFIAIAQALKIAEQNDKELAEQTANKLDISMDEIRSKTPDELQQNIRDFVAEHITEDIYKNYENLCEDPSVDPNCNIIKNVNNIEQFRAKIKSPEFQANESVYDILKQQANIHSVNIPVLNTNYNNVFKCQLNRDLDKENDIFILLQFKEDPRQQNSHYELIGVKKDDNVRTLFKFDQLPSFIRENYEQECTGTPSA